MTKLTSEYVRGYAIGLHDGQVQLAKAPTRKLTLYRDDSTTQIVFENVKHWFWTAGNTVLTIAQYTNMATGTHKYINWPRERFCWFKDEPQHRIPQETSAHD